MANTAIPLLSLESARNRGSLLNDISEEGNEGQSSNSFNSTLYQKQTDSCYILRHEALTFCSLAVYVFLYYRSTQSQNKVLRQLEDASLLQQRFQH